MALKRSSKGFGKAINRPMASAVRNVEVMAARQMTPGQAYESWLCKGKGCGLVIAPAATAPTAKAAASEPADRLVTAKCPHCGNEDLYRWDARANHPYVPKETPASGSPSAA